MNKKVLSGLVASTVAAGLLVAGAGAGAASAETLHRSGSKTVTIKPVGAPAGAKVTKARVTVKKGKKTVAKNKKSYKAKKGKYKVTSTTTYRPLVWREVPASVLEATCEVWAKEIVGVNTDDVDYTDEGLTVFEGTVTMLYTGTCYDRISFNDKVLDLEWDTEWAVEEDAYFEADENATEAELDAIATDSTGLDLGELETVEGWQMETLPQHQDFGAKQTVKNTRTVVVA